jgi:hypothetical protein
MPIKYKQFPVQPRRKYQCYNAVYCLLMFGIMDFTNLTRMNLLKGGGWCAPICQWRHRSWRGRGCIDEGRWDRSVRTRGGPSFRTLPRAVMVISVRRGGGIHQSTCVKQGREEAFLKFLWLGGETSCVGGVHGGVQVPHNKNCMVLYA